MQETRVQSGAQEDPLEKEIATRSSILAGKTPWTEETVGLHPGGGNDKPFQYSCLENPMGRGAWRATVHRVGNNQI